MEGGEGIAQQHSTCRAGHTFDVHLNKEHFLKNPLANFALGQILLLGLCYNHAYSRNCLGVRLP